MPKIFLIYYKRATYLMCYAIAEDGAVLETHTAENPEHAKNAMESEQYKRKYVEHYPSGYDLVWERSRNPSAAYQAALALVKTHPMNQMRILE